MLELPYFTLPPNKAAFCLGELTKLTVKKRVLTTEGVTEALRKTGGNMAEVGRQYGVTRQAVTQFIDKRPALVQAMLEERESMIDLAESQLYKQIKAGNMTAIIFYLKTQAKSRGYIEVPAAIQNNFMHQEVNVVIERRDDWRSSD